MKRGPRSPSGSLETETVKDRSRKDRDVVSGGVLFVASVSYFLGTMGLPAGKGEPGPRFFPMILSCALAILGVSILLKGFIEKPRPTEETEGELQRGFAKVALAVVATAGYVALLETLGFLLSTWLYTLSVTVMFRRDRVIEPVVVPIVSTFLIYLLFRGVLGARLPGGVMRWP